MSPVPGEFCTIIQDWVTDIGVELPVLVISPGECNTVWFRVKNVSAWLQVNKRLTNIDTSFLSFFKTVKKLSLIVNICIKDNSLYRVSQVEFLRTISHDKSTWKPHIDYISQKLSKAIAMVYSLKAYFTPEAICGLYYCPGHPYTTYCNVVWGNNLTPLIARFMGPTWGPPGAFRTQMGPCWPHESCSQGPFEIFIATGYNPSLSKGFH